MSDSDVIGQTPNKYYSFAIFKKAAKLFSNAAKFCEKNTQNEVTKKANALRSLDLERFRVK